MSSPASEEFETVWIEQRPFVRRGAFIFGLTPGCPGALMYNGQRYLRFIDFIYHPKAPSDWNRDEVLLACRIRHEHGQHFIDTHLNSHIARLMNSGIKQFAQFPLVALELGCGDGRFTGELLEALDVRSVGVDADYKALKRYAALCRPAVLAEMTSLPFMQQCFNLCIAMFVFHFRTLWPTLEQLRFLLKRGGLFATNYYGPDEHKLIAYCQSNRLTLHRRVVAKQAASHDHVVLFFLME